MKPLPGTLWFYRHPRNPTKTIKYIFVLAMRTSYSPNRYSCVLLLEDRTWLNWVEFPAPNWQRL